MANPKHVRVVKQGKEAIAEWRREHPAERLDLTEADLILANLLEANLSLANLTWADLTGADLTGANLSGAHLFVANLSGANLSGADLSGADLTGANLSEANLSEADLTRAKCAATTFADNDLSQAKGLESVEHQTPSSIGVDTLIASFRGAGNRPTPEMETFFRLAGVPQELLAELPKILAEVRYFDCFVCYGKPNEAFAVKLYEDLKARGVSTWLYPMDATPGKRPWKEIGVKRRKAEKMVGLCSVPALIRKGVLKELEEQIDEGRDIVPVSLDNSWWEEGFQIKGPTRDLGSHLRDLTRVDFSDASSYEKSLEKLLKGLERRARRKRAPKG